MRVAFVNKGVIRCVAFGYIYIFIYLSKDICACVCMCVCVCVCVSFYLKKGESEDTDDAPSLVSEVLSKNGQLHTLRDRHKHYSTLKARTQMHRPVKNNLTEHAVFYAEISRCSASQTYCTVLEAF